ncbi:MAG: hypothetical protein Q9213_000825 [Squamulea squamosa]
MSSSSLPIRWIACVDGTWCSPDGAYGNRHDNISNIYRICASIKVGECFDEVSGLRFNQQKRYYTGLGSEKNIAWLKRLEAGAFGSGFSDQIKEVYRDCCMIPHHPQNEIWLFGFSRGAYVVRAVASLLHHIRVLKSAGTPSYDKDFKSALQDYRSLRGGSKPGEVGHLHQMLATSTREAPRLQFIGVLDTVKALDDSSLYDISFNDSIQHVRHALSLNEDRKAFKPKPYLTVPGALLSRQSLIEAWFVGAHLDIGGSAAKDGLALYPLQWMLIESRAKGLVLQFDGSFANRACIDNPLTLVFPSSEAEGKGADMSTFTIANGIKIQMQDLRQVHKLPNYRIRHAVHLTKSSRWLRKKLRAPFFENAGLKGYLQDIPQGTILHPSVYLIFDEYRNVSLESRSLPFRYEIEEERSKVLTTEDVFWTQREQIAIEAPGAIRILVCGNTGVGKSTLINEVFGAEMTEVSDRTLGQHDIKIPLSCEGRPDLIIHDSGGFESGGATQMQQLREFVTEMSKAVEIENRLHMIWSVTGNAVAVLDEMNSRRVPQQAAAEFFATISQRADIPIVVVQTKKDELWDLQYGKARREELPNPEHLADQELRKRMLSMEEDLLSIKDARYDAVVAVSRGLSRRPPPQAVAELRLTRE